MSVAVEQARPRTEVSGYPNYAQAKFYANNFRRGARKAYVHTKAYAYYTHPGYLKVLVTRLLPNFYSVVAYPMDGFHFATLHEVLNLEAFRGWLLTYDTRHHKWYLILSTSTAGSQRFKRVRQAIRSSRTLSRASQTYLAPISQP